MSTVIKTEQPKYAPELLTATEATLKAHGLRLKPTESLVSIIDAVTAKGFKLEESFGYLNATQTGPAGTDMPVHLNTLFEGLATKEPEHFFPREVGGVTSRDAMDQAGKIKFISEFGADAYAQLPQTAPTEQTVVLDRTKLTKAQYMSLDRATRAQLSGQWGADVISKVLNRK